MSRYTLSKHEAISSLLDQGTCIDPSYVAHDDAIDEEKVKENRSFNISGSQENIGSTIELGLTYDKAGDNARTVITNAYNYYNRTTKMTTLKESNINNTSLSSKFGGLVIICMVILFLFILFSQLEFGCSSSSRTAGGKSLHKHKASKRTKLRQVLPLLVAILIGMSLRKQTIIVDSYFTGVDYTKGHKFGK